MSKDRRSELGTEGQEKQEHCERERRKSGGGFLERRK
jgi:hypothetical protein